MASVLWSLHLTVALMEFWFLQTHLLGLGPFCIACRHLTCWGGCTLSTYAFQTAVESEISQAGVPMSYSQKTDCLILGASHCLPQYGFMMYRHLEDIKFQVFSSYSPSPRLVAMAFYSSNSWQVPNFISSRQFSSVLLTSCLFFSLSFLPHSHLLPLFLISVNPRPLITCLIFQNANSSDFFPMSCLLKLIL